MADEAVRVSQQQTKPIKIGKWKVRQGNTVPLGRIVLLYDFVDAEKPVQRKLKAIQAGIIQKIWVGEGKIVQPGEPLYEIKSCSHPTIMNDMCAECGADLRKDDTPKVAASVPMIHAIPDLKVSEEQAQKIGQADNDRLIKDRKLVLLVDLDQTLIHTTNDNIPPNIRNVYHFQLYGSKSPWYHTRLRPGTHKFLNNVCEYYELHICTFGARNYAHTIAMFLDGDQKFFSNRILSRDECFDPTSKKANLKALFPCGDNMVCIIDDREDVWSHATNLIHVKPYHFFQHTGDINAPPGLDKHEADEKEGVDLTKIVNKTEKNLDSQSSEETDGSNVVSSTTCAAIEDGSEDVKNGVTELSNKGMNQSTENCNNSSQEQKKSEVESDSVVEQKISIKEDSENSEIVNINTKTTEIEEDLSHKQLDSAESNTRTISEQQSEKVEDNGETITKTENESNGKLKAVSVPAENKQDEHLIDIEDPDDYLIYLEDILRRIHRSYYELYDKMESGKIPDLKTVIPYVKSRVLSGCNLVFSGLVPTHYKLEESKAYQVGRSLGAHIQADLEDNTTHLVAVKPGTAKVNAGRRKKNLKIVTPDWLWCCAERWEHVDERIFPLNAKGSKNRHPPPHCSSPEHGPSYPEHDTPALRKRTPSGRFMDTINPLMSFSSADIADMDKEVEDILDDETDDSEGEQMLATQAENDVEEAEDTDVEEVNFQHMIQTEILDMYNKQTNDEEQGTVKISDENDPFEEGRSKRKRSLEDRDDELPSRKFRSGEDLDELDMDPYQDPDDNDSDSFGAPDEEDDGEWNMMGEALEREFLSE